MIFKCKMCGGTIEFSTGDTVGTCDSCGTRQTLPRLDNEKKAGLYERAEQYRKNNEYDRAAAEAINDILIPDNTEARKGNNIRKRNTVLAAVASAVVLAGLAALIANIISKNGNAANTKNTEIKTPDVKVVTVIITEPSDNELPPETVPEKTVPVTELKTEPTPSPEPVIDFDVDDSVAASYNSDGTIRLEYNEAPLTLTLPSSWKGKFAVRNGNLYSRTAYYSADINDGKLMTILFRDYEEGIEGITKYIGKAGNKHCYYARVTDVRFDMYSKEETDEYNFLMQDVQSIYESAECVAYNNEMPAADRLPKYGEVSSHGQYVSGHSVLGGYGDWPVENGWHITAVSRSTYNGEIWYDCYDTDDGDHYGWINESYVYFY